MEKCESLDIVIQNLLDENVVGFPTETVYGLAIISDSIKAFNNLAKLKNRPIDKPLTVMVDSIDKIYELAHINNKQKKIIENLMPGPITIIVKAKNNLPYTMNLGSKYLGIRIPNHAVALEILRKIKKPLLVTSANLSSQKALTKYSEVYDLFKDNIKVYVKEDSNETVASTIVDLTQEEPKLIREGKITLKQILKYWEE